MIHVDSISTSFRCVIKRMTNIDHILLIGFAFGKASNNFQANSIGYRLGIDGQ
jgi:hypothetical protein